jgi:4-oxalomesaconate hydratase
MIQPNARVLVFSAHAADFCSRAGGTIARFTEAGGKVHVVDLTYGERCESPALYADGKSPSPEEVKAARAGEIQAAASVLGATAECLDFGDSPLVIDTERRLRLIEALRVHRPGIVLTHWLHDLLHPDHMVAAEHSLWACAYAGAPGIRTGHAPAGRPVAYCYETTIGTSPVSRYLPDTYVDIGTTFERKMEALRHLKSQPDLPRMYDICARYRAIEARMVGGIGGCQFAEGFVKIGAHG